MEKPPKFNQKIYVLYVNVTTFYTSFKIEQSRYLGKLEKKLWANDTHIHIVESETDDVNYLSLDEIFESEEEAELHLAEIILDKYK